MMDNEVKLDHPLPDDVIGAARELYAAPASDAYWAGLHSQVMARVAENAGSGRVPSGVVAIGGREWWQVVTGWSRIGLAAAAAVLIALGALLLRSHNQEIRSAAAPAVKPAPVESLVPSGALGEREGSDSRDATFRDVIAH
jgi:hypothetical protein